MSQTFEPHGFKQFTPENWLVPDMPHYFPDYTPGKWIEHALESKLSADVPEEISKLFEVARGAIIQGWFFYPLLTLGDEQLHRVQEAAARMRCDQLKITPMILIKSGKRKGQHREPTFSDLIAVLVTHGSIARSEVRHWESTRWLRNFASHPKRQSIYSPAMAFNGLRVTAKMINKLFSNPEQQPPK